MNSFMEDLGCTNICIGCPVAQALCARNEELISETSSSMSEARLAMQKTEAIVAAEALNTAAGQIACKSISKELPAAPDTMPAVGSQQLITYVSTCPSFPTYLEVRGA